MSFISSPPYIYRTDDSGWAVQVWDCLMHEDDVVVIDAVTDRRVFIGWRSIREDVPVWAQAREFLLEAGIDAPEEL